MHEMSVASSLMRSVLSQMQGRNLTKISQIVISVGPLSGVSPEALHFSFDTLRAGTALELTELVIQESDLMTLCSRCASSFPTSMTIDCCPCCGSGDLFIRGGDDLDILYFVAEENNE
jgi:hydrogenase nickel incorporation protein HypA/HybF